MDTEEEDDQKALNVRNFPQDLKWKCRERASKKRKTLRDWVIQVLREREEEEARKDRKNGTMKVKR